VKLVYEVGIYTDAQGIKYSAIFQRNANGKINICDDSPFYAGKSLIGTFDLPQSYFSCTFVGVGGRGSEDWGIFCRNKERLPCMQKKGTTTKDCSGFLRLSFDDFCVCNE
jgi:hypothetical protein